MKSSSRWLFIFGAAVVVLAVVAVVLVLTMTGEGAVTLLPEDTPEGTVQRYFLAIKAEDYEEAYSYLSFSAIPEGSRYSSYENWSQSFLQRQQRNAWKVTVGESSIINDTARVDVMIDVFRPDGPFDNPVHTNYYNFQLKKEGTDWKITAPIYPPYFY